MSFYQDYAWASDGGSSNLWGTTLTPSEVNAATFGVIIKGQNSDPDDGMTAFIDSVRITIYTTYS